MPRNKKPLFFFSLRSPYSWLAHWDLHHRYPDVVEQLEWKPFWEPDSGSEESLTEAGGRFIYTPMSREKHLYILSDVRRLARARGLEVGWPVDKDPHWEVPHLAYLAAAEQGMGSDFIAAASRVRWQEGRNICDRAVIGELAGELGLDGAELSRAADDPGLREQGLGALLEVYRYDVFGVPMFVHGREKYWGLDRLPAFVAAVRGAEAPVETPAEAFPSLAAVGSAHASDFGPAGGCG